MRSVSGKKQQMIRILVIFLVFDFGISFLINDHVDIDFTPRILHPNDSLKIDEQSGLVLKNRCSKASQRTRRRIVLGNKIQPKEKDEFRWAVAVFDNEKAEKKPICTGTLIGPNQVLTAAHCLVETVGNAVQWQKRDLYVAAGAHCITLDEECKKTPESSNRIIRKVANAAVPGEMFKGDNKRHGGDIAILILETPIKENDHIVFACLALKDMDLPYSLPNFIFWGWGSENPILTIQPSTLNYLKNASLFDCKAAKNLNDFDVLCVNSDAKDRGIAWGDSGSGLEYIDGDPIKGEHRVVGVSVYNMQENIQQSFATDVRVYAKWICEQIGICYMLSK